MYPLRNKDGAGFLFFFFTFTHLPLSLFLSLSLPPDGGSRRVHYRNWFRIFIWFFTPTYNYYIIVLYYELHAYMHIYCKPCSNVREYVGGFDANEYIIGWFWCRRSQKTAQWRARIIIYPPAPLRFLIYFIYSQLNLELNERRQTSKQAEANKQKWTFSRKSSRSRTHCNLSHKIWYTQIALT